MGQPSEVAELLRKLAFSYRFPFGKTGLTVPTPKPTPAKLTPPKVPSLTGGAEPTKVVPNPAQFRTEEMQKGLQKGNT